MESSLFWQLRSGVYSVGVLFCFFFLPVMLPSEIPNLPTNPPVRGFPIVWKLLLLHDSLSSGHRTGKVQFSFQSLRKAMPKNVQTTAQLHSSHTLADTQNSPRQASTIHEPWTFRCSIWILKRQRNQRSNCQHLLDHQKSKRVPEKNLLFLYCLCQGFWLCGSQ